MENRMNSRKGGCIFSLIKLAVIVVAIVAVVLYFCMGYIGDYAIKTATSGTEITGGVGDIKVNPFEQSVDVKNFYITNPSKKYNNETALSFEEAFVDLDITPVDLFTKKLIVIDEITIKGLKVNVEYSADKSITSTNLNDIVAILQKKIEGTSADSKQGGAAARDRQKKDEQYRFIIKKLKFVNGYASSSIAGKFTESPLPDFEILNIGVSNGGDTAFEIVCAVIPRIAVQATGGALKGLLNVSESEGKSLIKNISNSLNKLIEKKQSK